MFLVRTFVVKKDREEILMASSHYEQHYHNSSVYIYE
jgi:hypothetical protein